MFKDTNNIRKIFSSNILFKLCHYSLQLSNIIFIIHNNISFVSIVNVYVLGVQSYFISATKVSQILHHYPNISLVHSIHLHPSYPSPSSDTNLLGVPGLYSSSTRVYCHYLFSKHPLLKWISFVVHSMLMTLPEPT